MTTKFTSGPWTVSDNHGKRYIEPMGDNEPVAMICRGHADAYLHNANLIAAAPELLEACIAMIEWDDREKDFAVDFEARMDLCCAAFEKARAAIARAKGGRQ